MSRIKLRCKGRAGAGEMLFKVEKKTALAFRTDFLHTEGIGPQQTMIIYAKGNSLKLGFPDCAAVLIDRKKKIIGTAKKMFATRWGRDSSLTAP